MYGFSLYVKEHSMWSISFFLVCVQTKKILTDHTLVIRQVFPHCTSEASSLGDYEGCVCLVLLQDLKLQHVVPTVLILANVMLCLLDWIFSAQLSPLVFGPMKQETKNRENMKEPFQLLIMYCTFMYQYFWKQRWPIRRVCLIFFIISCGIFCFAQCERWRTCFRNVD